MAFDTPVNKIAVLITDPESVRLGRMGRLVNHDWQEYGTLFVQFPDKTRAMYDDDDNSKAETFYRKRGQGAKKWEAQGRGLDNLTAKYIKLTGSDKEKFNAEYRELFGETPS